MPQKGRLRPQEGTASSPPSPGGGWGAGTSSRLSASFSAFSRRPGLKARERADGGRPGELAGPEPAASEAESLRRQGRERTGLPRPRGWHSSPRHAQTVKAGQGEVGGGSLGFYLRCNSLAEDCS